MQWWGQELLIKEATSTFWELLHHHQDEPADGSGIGDTENMLGFVNIIKVENKIYDYSQARGTKPWMGVKDIPLINNKLKEQTWFTS